MNQLSEAINEKNRGRGRGTLHSCAGIPHGDNVPFVKDEGLIYGDDSSRRKPEIVGGEVAVSRCECSSFC